MMRIFGLVAGNPWAIFAVVGALLGSHVYVYSMGKARERDAAAQVALVVERVATKALLEANARATASNARFAQIQQDTEKRYHENQIAIDAARKQLADVKRLRDPGYRAADCRRLPQDTQAPGDTTDTASPGELSAEFTVFLRDQAYDADQVSIYAKACHDWAIGIAE